MPTNFTMPTAVTDDETPPDPDAFIAAIVDLLDALEDYDEDDHALIAWRRVLDAKETVEATLPEQFDNDVVPLREARLVGALLRMIEEKTS